MKGRVSGRIYYREPGMVRAGIEEAAEYGPGAAHRSILRYDSCIAKLIIPAGNEQAVMPAAGFVSIVMNSIHFAKAATGTPVIVSDYR